MGPEMREGRPPSDPFRDNKKSRHEHNPDDVPESSGSATEELRYEGPITFEDDAYETEAVSDGGGKTLFTAALLGGAVILIIGIALYLKDKPPSVETFAGLDEPAFDEPMFGDDVADNRAIVAGEAGTATESVDVIGEGGSSAATIRPVPESTETPVPERGVREAAPARVPPAPERPAPRVAGDQGAATVGSPSVARPVPTAAVATTSQVLRASTSAADGLAAGIAELVSEGRLGEAARMAQQRARYAPTGSWTLQVLFACQPATVDTAFGSADGSLLLFPVDHPQGDCYRLTWGLFTSREAALAETRSVPSHFSRNDQPLPITLTRAAGL